MRSLSSGAHDGVSLNRRVPVQPLRGSDLTLLEVTLPEMLKRPIGAIAPINVFDLIELAQTEGRPRTLDRVLQGFVDGIRRQIADIPKGRSWDMYLDELAEIEGRFVPLVFRAMLEDEMQVSERAQDRVRALLDRWGTQDPEPFVLSARPTRIQRAEMVKPREPSPEPSAAPRDRSGRTPAPASPRSSAPKALKPVQDIERRDFVVDQAIERLARAGEKGLQEMVLVAGIRHAAHDPYPDLTPAEITSVLRQLRDASRVRSSAARWMIVTRF